MIMAIKYAFGMLSADKNFHELYADMVDHVDDEQINT